MSIPLFNLSNLNAREMHIIGFEIHRFVYQRRPIVIFTVNPAYDRPVMFFGTAYLRVGSSKTTLGNHPEQEREIWNRRKLRDWSAQICEKATIADLSLETVYKARMESRKAYASPLPIIKGSRR
ncbi:MAG: hypothetical protein A2511_13535 [Deltaproteobacteria bacterium RIFOXYD12_FULL_50_9]|nr:MAG: hypothetical protein A2511_13535 [Deltaproteobacteria bacterium RIFOXYD12_FULL_50_9]